MRGNQSCYARRADLSAAGTAKQRWLSGRMADRTASHNGVVVPRGPPRSPFATLVGVFRRKQMPSHLAARWEVFAAQAQRVEDARQALLGCLPVGRVDPAPVPVGLDLLRDEVLAIDRELDEWRAAEVESQWRACRAALAEALEHIEATRATALNTDELEVLLDAVTDVIEPLDVWQDAERCWRALRVRR